MTLLDGGQWNPFISSDQGKTLLFSFADIENSDHDPNSYDCLLFAYDNNANGMDDGNSERFGYRLSENAVKIRSGNAGCSQSGWIKLSDDQTIRITGLSFSPRAIRLSTGQRLLKCQIDIVLEGALISNPLINLRLEQQLTIANLITDPSGQAALCK